MLNSKYKYSQAITIENQWKQEIYWKKLLLKNKTITFKFIFLYIKQVYKLIHLYHKYGTNR